MLDEVHLLGQLPLQDRDLLSRLSLYFDSLGARIREGQGWLIFSAAGDRANRISRYISGRLAGYRPLYSYYLVPWRDFALNAYIDEIELRSQPAAEPNTAELAVSARQKAELNIANRVARDTYYWMLHCDVLVLIGLRPAHLHEATYLTRVAETRHGRRLPTLLLTPRSLDELEAEFRALDTSGSLWSSFYRRAYETSLIAV